MKNRRLATLRVLNGVANKPFEYGRVDCYQIVAKVAQELTGTRPGTRHRYNTEAEARRIIEAQGGHVNFVSSFLGEPLEDLSTMRDGDAALIEIPDNEPALGVFFDSCVWVKTDKSLTPLKLDKIKEGWAIG